MSNDAMDDTQVLPVTAAAPLDVEVADLEVDDLDDEFLPRPRQRLGKLTIGLVALVLLGGGFVIGVEVQKSRPVSTASRGGAGAALRNAFGGRGAAASGGGAFPGFGGSSGSSAPSTTTTTPAVIGTIASVSGNTIVVTNFGGQSVTVKLSGSTAVTKTVPTSALSKGETVTVVGSKGSDGTVTATSVNAR